MVSAQVLFQPGWIHRKYTPGEENPLTGNIGPPSWVEIPGTGLLQQPLWSGMQEITAVGSRDERMVLFAPDEGPPVEISVADEMISPTGQAWSCSSEGLLRQIPGHPPDYVVVLVRRAEEKDR